MTAKGKSWRRQNPRPVLERLIEENPKAGKVKVLAMFKEHVNGRDGKHALDHIAEYWFHAHWAKLKGGDQ